MTVIHIGATMINAEATVEHDNDVPTLKMLAKQLLKERNEMYEMLGYLHQQLNGVEETLCWNEVGELLAKARGEQ